MHLKLRSLGFDYSMSDQCLTSLNYEDKLDDLVLI